MSNNFKKIFGIVAEFLGRTDLKDDKGKITLSEEEKAKLTAEWGEPFVTNFLAKVTEHEASEDTAAVRLAQLETEKATLATTLAQTTAQVANLQKTVETLMKEDDNTGAEVIPPKTPQANVVAFKPNMNYKHNLAVQKYLAGDAAPFVLGDTIETSELDAEFGKYVTIAGGNALTELLQPVMSMQYMTMHMAGTEWKISRALIDDVVQSFNSKWTPKGKATFTPIVVKNYKHKINVPIVPAEIMESYIAYLKYNEGVTPENMPIVKYIIDVLIKPKVDQNREMKLIATGEYEEFAPVGGITDGTAGQATGKSMDGYITVLAKAKRDALPVNWLIDDVASLMALTDEQVVEKMELACDSVSDVYQRMNMKIHIDPKLLRKYNRGYRAKYPTTKNEDKNKNTPDDSIFEFAPLDGMTGTGVFFITPKENFIHLEEKNSGANKIFLQTQNYEVKVFAEWWEGTGFAVAEAVFAYLPTAQEVGI